MPPSNQLISSASLGAQTQFGSASVANAALGVFPSGTDFFTVPPHLVHDGSDAANVVFDLTAVSTEELAIHFRFSGEGLVTSAGGEYFFTAGGTTVENVAQGSVVTGTDFFSTLQSIVSFEDPIHVLNLNQLGTPELAIDFVFSGTRLVTSVGGLDSAAIGDAEVISFISFAPIGWDSFVADQAIVAREDPFIRFDLSLPAAREIALQFAFDGENVVASVGALLSQVFGSTVVENAAQGVFASGTDHLRIGLPRSHDTAIRAGFFDLALTDPTLPPAISVQFPFGAAKSAIPHGFDSFVAGTDLGWIWLVYTQGFQHVTHYGSPLVLLDNELYVPGTDFTEFGMPKLPGIVVRGLQAYDFGTPDVFQQPIPADQFADGAGNIADLSFGTQFVSNYWRWAYPSGVYVGGYGDPFVAFYTRELEHISSQIFVNFGVPLVGYEQDVLMGGLDQSEFGDITVDLRRALPEGFDSLRTGQDIFLTHSPRYLVPLTWRADVSGEPTIFNRNKSVEFYNVCYTNSPHYCGVKFGGTPGFSVVNKHKTISMVGSPMTRFSVLPAAVANAGRPVLVAGSEYVTFPPYPQYHMISHFIRELPIPGLDSFRMVTHWTVHNAARALYPDGELQTEYGDLESILWRYLMQDGSRSGRFGLPWLSRSPRTVVMSNNNQSLQMPHVTVWFGSREIQFAGESYLRFPAPDAYARPPRTLTPRWRSKAYWDAKLIGSHTVRNDTPETGNIGRNSLDMGTPWIDYYTRYLGAKGWGSQNVGRWTWLFRDREIFMDPVDLLEISEDHRVQNDDPDPIVPTVQAVLDAGGIYSFADGRPRVTSNVLYMDSSLHTVYGATTITFNGIIFESDAWNRVEGSAKYGSPALFGGVDTLHNTGFHTLQVSKFDMSPRTIWCTFDVTQQAKTNHPGLDWRTVDAGGISHRFGRKPWIGNNMSIANADGAPQAPPKVIGRDTLRVPSFKVESSWQEIFFDMDEFYRPGFPTLLNTTTEYIQGYSASFPHTAYSKPSMSIINGPQYISAGMGYTWTVPSHLVQNFNRPVYMTGLDATQYGNNHPMVHHPRTITVTDNDLTTYGTQWVSHSPRTVALEGRDMFVSTWTELAKQMKVDNYNDLLFGYAYLDFTEWGVPVLTLQPNNIIPYGIEPPCVPVCHEVMQ